MKVPKNDPYTLSSADIHDALAEIPENNFYNRVLSKPCPTCGASPGDDCYAPRKLARWFRIYELRTLAGTRPVTPSPVLLTHARRQDQALKGER
jgi:hypothetical protein